MVGIDAFFDELNNEAGFDMSGMYLGSGIDLDFIFHDINDYMSENDFSTLDKSKEYMM